MSSRRGGGAQESLFPEFPRSNPQAQMVERFAVLWREIRGGEYLPSWKRDAAAGARLLKALNGSAKPAEIDRRMRLALSDPWFQRAGNFTIFCSRWSNYDRGESSAAPRRVVGVDPATGALKYA